jgi:hypothetical protein
MGSKTPSQIYLADLGVTYGKCFIFWIKAIYDEPFAEF